VGKLSQLQRGVGSSDQTLLQYPVSAGSRAPSIHYLLDKFGACVMCGWAERNPVTGKIPLHIDHIDGDWRNNRPENLRVLCPNHHALTANYGALNRGNGRPYHVIKTPPAA